MIPVMKNSPWLRRAGMLDGDVVLDSGTSRALVDDEVSLSIGSPYWSMFTARLVETIGWGWRVECGWRNLCVGPC